MGDTVLPMPKERGNPITVRRIERLGVIGFEIMISYENAESTSDIASIPGLTSATATSAD
jgi:hypothetical protein